MLDVCLKSVHILAMFLECLIFVSKSKNVVVALLNFSFELTFAMIVPGNKDKETENIKLGNFIGLKLEKDECDCEFVAADPKEYLAWKK